MKLKDMVIIVALFGFGPVWAAQVDNSAMVKKYNAQVNDVIALVTEVVVTVDLGIDIAKAYSQFRGLPEVATHSRHIQRLREDADQLFGNSLVETPFPSCRELIYHVDSMWTARQDLARLGKSESKELAAAEADYLHSRNECVNEIKIPPSPTKEETAIIDASNP
ncbi:hypothetical protein [Limnobaculum xujianqingii]|uniref:hypothetical protein n=1 Tax=Limnobaculum xujianqingii TaxID=2738837 RepID=UPI0011269BF6|nr:hypothetical protein [Limnobaculum xujianqingii]